MIIAPSLLSADFSCLKNEVIAIEKAGADWLHLDVMDGHFVPNLTFGAILIKSLRPHSSLFFDAHLMVQNPLERVGDYIKAGVNQITVHIETLQDPRSDLQKIKALGVKVGLSLKPKTPLTAILPYLDIIDTVLVMTVEPGFGGQKFIDSQLEKIKIIHQAIVESGQNITLQVDGGINPKTIAPCLQAGAHAFVAGSAIFKGNSSQYKENITALRQQ